MYPRVDIRGAGLRRQLITGSSLVRLAEGRFGVGAGFEDVAFAEEPVPGHGGSVGLQVGVGVGVGGDFLFDLFGGGLGGHAGNDGDAAVDAAPCRDRGGPVAGVDDCDVEV